MGQDINEMMQEAPVLTLDPFGEDKRRSRGSQRRAG